VTTCAQQVCDALCTRLTGNIGIATAVVSDRLHPINAETLPDCVVFAGEEKITGATIGFPRLQKHELDVHIAYRAKAVSGLDAALDAGFEAIVGQLFDTLAHKKLTPLNVTLDEVARHRVLPDPDSDDPNRTGSAIGKAVLTLVAKFNTRENAPTAFL
jgi:hypothetical protein